MSVIEVLEETINQRIQFPKEGSYTCKLLAAGKPEMLKKIGEEASEVLVAGALETRERLVYETADLVYHLLVLLRSQDISWADIEQELAGRFK